MEVDYKTLLQQPEYTFLKKYETESGRHPMLIALSGSHAYGTNVETSDIDIRGCMTPTADDIIRSTYGKPAFEQLRDKNTDTVMYSFYKMVHLLTESNPSVLEILGCLPEHYLYISKQGEQLLNTKQAFLSKRIIKTFGGFANNQLHRMQNAITRNAELKKRAAKCSSLMDGFTSEAKLNKYAMHAVRTLLTGIDLLEQEQFIIYRGNDLSLLHTIRRGAYFQKDTFVPEYFEMVKNLQTRFNSAAETTKLPDEPDYDTINKMVRNVSYSILQENKSCS